MWSSFVSTKNGKRNIHVNLEYLRILSHRKVGIGYTLLLAIYMFFPEILIILQYSGKTPHLGQVNTLELHLAKFWGGFCYKSVFHAN